MHNIIVFIFGLFIGSFLNCVVYRLELKCRGGVLPPDNRKGEKTSPLRGRSFCPECRHTLSWLDLIPIFSYLFLQGRCRYCSKHISIQYPLVELATAILFVAILNHESGIMNYEFLFIILYSLFLIPIFVYDLKHFIIPDRILFPAIIIALGYIFIFNYELITNHIFSALAVSGFFGAIVLVSRGKWMGMGDVKLAILIGLLLGFPNILISLFFAFLIGAIIGVGLIFLKKKTLKSEVPFGPFLILGIYIALFFGDQIVKWYLNILI